MTAVIIPFILTPMMAVIIFVIMCIMSRITLPTTFLSTFIVIPVVFSLCWICLTVSWFKLSPPSACHLIRPHTSAEGVIGLSSTDGSIWRPRRDISWLSDTLSLRLLFHCVRMVKPSSSLPAGCWRSALEPDVTSSLDLTSDWAGGLGCRVDCSWTGPTGGVLRGCTEAPVFLPCVKGLVLLSTIGPAECCWCATAA